MRRSFYFLLLSLYSLLLTAQQYRHYGPVDGLSSNEISAICQNEHFIWIATSDGLNRFDGQHFKVFKKDRKNNNCLSENNIETLYFDSEGLLWIGLKTGGVNIYDPQQDSFIHLNQLIDVPSPSRVISIFEDSQKHIWLGTWEQGIYKLTPTPNNKKRHYKVEKLLPGFIVSYITEKPKGYIWLGTYTGGYIYNLQKQTCKDIGGNFLSITQITPSLYDENSLWCSSWNQGLSVFKWESPFPNQAINITQACKEVQNTSIHKLCQSNNGVIYLGTWGEGIKVFNPFQTPILSSLNIGNSTTSLINALFMDNHNNLWIGTYGEGLFKYMLDNNGIEEIPLNKKLTSPITTIEPLSDNKLLLGTLGTGLCTYDLSNGQVQFHNHGKESNGFRNYILSIYKNADIILVGHDDKGVMYASPDNKNYPNLQFREYTTGNDLLKSTAFYFENPHKLWVGTKQNGLISYQYNPSTHELSGYRHYNSFSRNEITGFAPLDNNHLFISSHDGLSLFNTQANEVEKHGHIINNEIVYSIVKDAKNNCLWVGTSTELLKVNLNDSIQTESMQSTTFLPQGAIKKLILDEKNNLWFFIGGKIFCLLDSEKKIKEINMEDLGNYTILNATKVTVKGEEHIIFCTTDNFILISPQKAIYQPDKSRIILTDLQIDHQKVEVNEKIHGKIVLNKSPEYASDIILSYRARWISLSFTETNLSNFKNKYLYRITGFTDTWQYLDISRPITFSQLNPGKYQLEIRKDTNDDKQSPCWSIGLTVTPPWWNTIWFYILEGFMLLAVISYSIYFTINHYRKKQRRQVAKIEKRKKEELLHEKESFFAGLSHDLLTPLSLIIAPANDLLRESGQNDPSHEKLEIITKNASFLSNLFSTILDFKRAELPGSQLNEKNIEFISFIRIIVNVFNYLANSKNISLDFETNIEKLYLKIDNVKVERILYNLLSNALKYTPEYGSINVLVRFEHPDLLSIIVKDTGDGIDKQHQAKVFEKFYREAQQEQSNIQGLGLGLYIVKRFVKMLNGNIEIDSELQKGTEIRITLPVSVTETPDTDIPTNDNDFISGKAEESPTILLVEDNEQMRNYLKEKLSTHFYVITASDGQEALDRLESYLPEIIISDVLMPNMDGLTLCRKIKETPLFADIFVILLSAKSSTDDELKGYKEGADIYLKKPFDPDALMNQIINIHTTRQHRKSQLLSKFISKDENEIEFNSKEVFIQQAMKIIEEHLMDANFKIDEFASAMNTSKTVLHRKFKIMIGQTPNQFIRTVRLRKATDLLRNNDLSIAEIAYLTGFNQSHYFIKCFREAYNDTPKNFRQQINGESFGKSS